MGKFDALVEDVCAFHEHLGLPVGSVPQRLSDERKDFGVTCLKEELEEFQTATTIEDEADALLDLAYFAVGRLVEMGIPLSPAWEEVQRANLDKKRGEGKRGTKVDATKPPGWKPPDHSWMSAMPTAFVEASRILARKQKDYRGDGSKLSEYFPFGLKSHVQMIWTKARRLVSLTNQETPPEFEPVADTLLDCMNYCAFAWSEEFRKKLVLVPSVLVPAATARSLTDVDGKSLIPNRRQTEEQNDRIALCNWLTEIGRKDLAAQMKILRLGEPVPRDIVDTVQSYVLKVLMGQRR